MFRKPGAFAWIKAAGAYTTSWFVAAEFRPNLEGSSNVTAKQRGAEQMIELLKLSKRCRNHNREKGDRA